MANELDDERTPSGNPLAVVFGVHCNASVVARPDHELGVVALELAADRRARVVLAPETALQLALDLVATVNLLRRPPEVPS